MNYYYLGENDQVRSSWVLFDLVKPAKKHRRSPKLPSVIHQFFGPQPDGEMKMKEQYLPICCAECGRYTEDAVFKIGFNNPVCLRIKGDFSHTQDRVFVVSDRFLRVLKQAKVKGYETKAIGSGGWNALLVTHHVDCQKGVFTPAEPFCPKCHLPDGAVGGVERLDQLSVPAEDNVIFTTKANWHRRLWDRDIFVGGAVVDALKAGGITGGYCNRLWTAEEVRIGLEKKALGKKWKPAGIGVLLNGRTS